MIEHSVSGGGFFFSAFTKCAAFPDLSVNCGVGAYGAWAHGAPPFVLTDRARFIQIDVEPNLVGVGPTYIQFGTGAAGSEIIWQPTGGTAPQAFTIVWTGLFTWQNPYSFVFPSSLPRGTELCARAQIAGGAMLINVSFYLFN